MKGRALIRAALFILTLAACGAAIMLGAMLFGLALVDGLGDGWEG